MEVKIAKLQPTEKNYTILRSITESALTEQLHELLRQDWHLYKDMKGFEILSDKRLETLLGKHKYNWNNFKYIVQPVRQEDLQGETVKVFVARIDQPEGKQIGGYLVWAKNNELDEYDILLFMSLKSIEEMR